MIKHFFLAAVAIFCTVASANAQVLFDEITGAEGSGDPNAPTSLGTLSAGAFTVSGSSAVGPLGTAAGTLTDTTRDLFGFTIASGFQLDSIEVTALEQTLNNAAPTPFLDPGFYFLDAGTTTVIPSATTSASLLTGQQFGIATTPIGTNLLDTASVGNITAGPGVTAPLAAGDFVLGFQQTGPETISYSVQLNVSSVPEPSSAALLSMAALGLAGFRRRRS